MKNVLFLVGIGAAILIVGAWYAFSHTKNSSDSDAIVTTKPMSAHTLSLTSPSFENGQSIPSEFTCDGQNGPPTLAIAGVPQAAKSLALIMDDPDVPKVLKPDGVFDHWVLFNIPASTTRIDALASVGTAGINGAGKNAYTGPCPPPQYQPNEHRYFFRLYALDSMLNLPEGASKRGVLNAMQGHIIAQAELMGVYKRK